MRKIRVRPECWRLTIPIAPLPRVWPCFLLCVKESGGWKPPLLSLWVLGGRLLVWRGQDSNLRSPEGRRVYSPLPLSTRPPLLIAIGEFLIPIRPVLSFLPVHPTFLQSSLIAREDTGSAKLYALQITESNRKWDDFKPMVARSGHGFAGRQSWRRESNPQPTDYKSVALPLSYASSEAFPLVGRVRREHYHNSP